ncbi:ankyrin repeat domain-containing protein [Amycolatopsis samaneae]|uniref:Ankyrin repeat domain-containing protein n=1 Tax=Amycolatopsis samaneae TaxID=664691 RepID=A0ABW5GDF0_9PSEU
MRDDHPAIVAAGAGDLARLTALLGAEPEAVNVRGWMGITPLMAAVWQADSATVARFLLARGADPLAVRSDGDGALHRAASGEVAELLAAAAGPVGLAARYLFGQTPLHVAVDEGHLDVVRVFLAHGADPAAVDRRGDTPLDLADDPRIARLLVEAGAPPQTGRSATPLHLACRRATRDPGWVPVIELLLERGADPGRRDEFGSLPSDLLGEHEVRDRLVTAVTRAGREVDLTPTEAAAHRQERVAIRPDGTEAVTSTFSGTVLVRWRLAPAITPVEALRVGVRSRARGPYGAGLVFADDESVWLRDWDDLRRSRVIAAELVPEEPYPHPVLSGDGRFLLVASAECLRLIDLEREETAGELGGLGDWSIEARFAPDERTIAVGNSMQGTCWLTILDANLGERSVRQADLPSSNQPETVSDVAFAPDGRTVATWIRPDRAGHNGYRGLAAVTRTHDGEPAWHRHVDDGVAGAPGKVTSAALCFTSDGSRLAVGLDTGILWLDAKTGTPTGHDTLGSVTALASHPALGVLAATDHGLHRLDPR